MALEVGDGWCGVVGDGGAGGCVGVWVDGDAVARCHAGLTAAAARDGEGGVRERDVCQALSKIEAC